MILSPLPRCPAPYALMAFSAVLVFTRSRNFIPGLCKCDLLLPIAHPSIPPCWPSSEDIANTLGACAGCTESRMPLHHPAWRAQLLLLQKACRPVVFLRPSSRLFRPH